MGKQCICDGIGVGDTTTIHQNGATNAGRSIRIFWKQKINNNEKNQNKTSTLWFCSENESERTIDESLWWYRIYSYITSWKKSITKHIFGICLLPTIYEPFFTSVDCDSRCPCQSVLATIVRPGLRADAIVLLVVYWTTCVGCNRESPACTDCF